MALPAWKSPKRTPKDGPVLAKVKHGRSISTSIVLWTGNRFLDLTQPRRYVRVLAWHCRVPCLHAK